MGVFAKNIDLMGISKDNAVKTPSPWTFCVAPMMDWTDRHCRFFHRQLSQCARLYTEMVTTGAVLHGDAARHLDFSAEEHPLALQLGGSEPDDLARAARLAAQWGYDEVNLNCGCPSERVQKGAFGACLMAEAPLVADCVKAMRDAVSLPVTVKHRIGIDHIDEYGFMRDFVGTVAAAGCEVFIVHARNAILKGLSPKENREIPPLKYEWVAQLKREMPHLTIVLNGGITQWDAIAAHLRELDGVMLGREAYHHPFMLSEVDARLFGRQMRPSREGVALRMAHYARATLARTKEKPHPTHLRHIARHMLGLYNGMPGAKAWRRSLSDSKNLAADDADLLVRVFGA
jgi:tRNA-dihydrouridine synthase A